MFKAESGIAQGRNMIKKRCESELFDFESDFWFDFGISILIR